MSSNFLEQLASEWYAYKGYFVRQNVLVGKRARGGYECELDVVAFNPETKHLVHMEPSMDCYSWGKREARYHKKFQAGKKHIPALFRGTTLPTEIEQIALFEYASSKQHETVGGGKVKLVREFLKEIKEDLSSKMINNNAVSEHMPLLRMIQFMCHYNKFIYPEQAIEANESPRAQAGQIKTHSDRKNKQMCDLREAIGLKTFVEFYQCLKNGSRKETIGLLKQKGYTKTSIQTKWGAGRNIFNHKWEMPVLEYISASKRVDGSTREKARDLLLNEKR